MSIEYNIEFIDTIIVLDLMWYSSEYWCHYRGEPGRVEAFYALKQIFNDTMRGGVDVISYIPVQTPIFIRY